jgi:hypothetical protein
LGLYSAEASSTSPEASGVLRNPRCQPFETSLQESKESLKHPLSHRHPVIALVTAGVAMDVLSLTYVEYSDVEREAIVHAHPRSDHFKEDIIHAFYDGKKHKPESTFGLGNLNFGFIDFALFPSYRFSNQKNFHETQIIPIISMRSTSSYRDRLFEHGWHG